MSISHLRVLIISSLFILLQLQALFASQAPEAPSDIFEYYFNIRPVYYFVHTTEHDGVLAESTFGLTLVNRFCPHYSPIRM